MTLKEFRKRPKTYFKYENGVGIYYNRWTNTYSFDIETEGL